MGNWNSHNLSLRMVFYCQGHSNWTVCSLLNQFSFEIFPFYRSHTFIIPYFPRERKLKFVKRELMLGKILSTVELILYKNKHTPIAMKSVRFPFISRYYAFVERCMELSYDGEGVL